MKKLIVKLPARFEDLDVARFGEALQDISMAHSAMRVGNNPEGAWGVEWLLNDDYCDEMSDIKARFSVIESLYGYDLEALEFNIEDVPEDVDWLQQCYQQFPPFTVGPFFIYGSHYEGSVPEGLTGLQIDAATAFGSGEHGTTNGCLQAMLELKSQGQCPWNVLDMGTGSGILAVAAWKLWKTPILAVDNDDEAVRVADVHRALNAVPSGKTEMSTACGDGFKTQEVQAKKPYDLIIANILASALLEMVDGLVEVLDDNGYVILSGILIEQSERVISAYEARGLVFKKRYDIGEWCTLIMKKA
ncbi:MAG: hypothetical protein CMH26_04825 [Micavibrio sp.]|nr:hypothetical protein [Micavibrio sp.]